MGPLPLRAGSCSGALHLVSSTSRMLWARAHDARGCGHHGVILWCGTGAVSIAAGSCDSRGFAAGPRPVPLAAARRLVAMLRSPGGCWPSGVADGRCHRLALLAFRVGVAGTAMPCASVTASADLPRRTRRLRPDGDPGSGSSLLAARAGGGSVAPALIVSGAMSVAIPNLQTARLTLRQARADDAEAIRSYRSHPGVARFQSWTDFDEADARRLVDSQHGLSPDTPGTWFQLVILDRILSSPVGDLALHFREDDHRQVELGINIAPSRQGKGYAVEATMRVLGYLFEDLRKHRVTAVTDVANDAAARLFRRAGFRQEGHFVDHVWFKGRYDSEYLFALLADEWRSGAGGHGFAR